MTTLFRQPTQPDDRATEFKAVEPTAGETYNGQTLMVVAYGAIWVIIMAWLFMLWRKAQSQQERLEGLERALDRAAAAADKKEKKAT